MHIDFVMCKKSHYNSRVSLHEAPTNKPGTAQVGDISTAQKIARGLLKVSKYSLLQYRKKTKVGPNWRARGDALRFFIHFVAYHQKN